MASGAENTMAGCRDGIPQLHMAARYKSLLEALNPIVKPEDITAVMYSV
jgi:hypothetical protein